VAHRTVPHVPMYPAMSHTFGSRSRAVRRPSLRVALVSAVLMSSIGSVGGALTVSPAVAAPGEQVSTSPEVSPTSALSTSGDFATDAFSDPWDFDNAEDLITVDEVGTQYTSGVSIADGLLNVNTRVGSTIRLLFDWPGVLPWGRDGRANPIDAERYTQTTFRICTGAAGLGMAVRFETSTGQEGFLPFNPPAGCSVQHFDLTYQGPVPDFSLQYPVPGMQGPWAGSIVRFEIHRGGVGGAALVQLDWVRVHRADASQTPVTTPVPRVLTPNIEGGADYATVERGDPWDMSSGSDVASTHQVTNLSFPYGDLSGTTVGNDPFVELALGPELNTDRYRRLTLDACYEGPFGLTDTAGGGMNGRMAWMPRGAASWTETQDFVVFPGCHRMTIDMATTPPDAIHDEASQLISGWRGMRPAKLRFDVTEDRGLRNFAVREVRLADDAAFSTSYPITFLDAAGAYGATADIYVTTSGRGRFDGVRIARNLPVADGVNTFTWNGTTDGGVPLGNGTYWVYIVMRTSNAIGTGSSTGPVRVEKPVPSSPGSFVPLTPARLLDTRTGIGGNITSLGPQVHTELDVTGVGGVPEVGATAVVLNVTVDGPTLPGYVSVWPSGEERPIVSNLNYLPGQTVPNLVTVKVGANGRVNLFNSNGNSHLIADVVGYYTPVAVSGSGRFTSLAPSRVLDTRDGVGVGSAGPLAPDSVLDLKVTGVGGVPSSGVQAVVLNITVDQPTASGFVTAWPTGEPFPTASTHNFTPGLTIASLVIAKVGAGGMVSLYNSNGNTHLVADVVGYLSGSGGRFVPVAPDRAVDTRDGTGGVLGAVGEGGSIRVTLAGRSSIPANATAVVVNITAADSTSPSYLTAWPSGSARPTASIANPRPGVPVPNQAYLKLGPGGQLDIYNNSGSTHVVVDVFGYVV